MNYKNTSEVFFAYRVVQKTFINILGKCPTLIIEKDKKLVISISSLH